MCCESLGLRQKTPVSTAGSENRLRSCFLLRKTPVGGKPPLSSSNFPLCTLCCSLENIIDDWVLMGFLVGNDFIPHLPNMHINKGALPELYGAYKVVIN